MSPQLKNLLQYRDLLIVFIWRNFSIKYRQTVLGVLWAIFQPLSLTLLFYLIFRTTEHASPLFFLTGLICWNFFSLSLASNIPVLTAHYSLVTKINFPREVLPISMVALAFIDYLIAWGVFIVFAIIDHLPFSPAALWSVPLTLLLVLFTLSLSLVFSCLNVFYRDLQLASNFFIQLMFFTSPVFYSVKYMGPKFKAFLHLNPLTFIIENFRRCLLDGEPVNVFHFFILLVFLIILLLLSFNLFKKVERKFADVI